MNPGIVKTVALLNANGFETCDSGDGETHDHPCDRPEGYVVVRVREAADMIDEAHRLCDVLSLNLKHPTSASVNCSYDPADEIAVIDIYPIHDRDLR